MSKIAAVTVRILVDDEDATYSHAGKDYRAVEVHWHAQTGLSTSVTAFGGEDDPGCEMWIRRFNETPAWVPDPPGWFDAAAKQMKEESE